eukprot:CAMPEP_0113898454 /NCGR_PEP_ID=MMETSP0780_2-20120614/19384_1 /TAXON_ID=652834 /ORGANISM="Palpitomonas bilix" /LENGTH=265 /DNA_ID=CAMNT_0000890311 /DNA_START=105 /DNA_END=899 /DNA_ORIENTATION=- /assembly_acc=CAM_ASM_000599
MSRGFYLRRGGSWVASTAAEIVEAARGRGVIFGEYHQQPAVADALFSILSAVDSTCPPGATKALVWEHFSLNETGMVEDFNVAGDIAVLKSAYAEYSAEGFDLSFYEKVLVEGRRMGFKHRCGFPPRPLASSIAAEGLNSPFFRDGNFPLPSLAARNHFFELITGSSEVGDEEKRNKLERMLLAQAVKDETYARTFVRASTEHDFVVGVCGKGHCEYRLGVPERISSAMEDNSMTDALSPLLVIAQSEDDRRDADIGDALFAFEW